MDASVTGPEGLLAPGSEITLENCHREPIATPGGIQPHGALLVLERASGRITQWSANAAERLGVDPADPAVVAGLAPLLHPPAGPDPVPAAPDPAAPDPGTGAPAGLRPRRIELAGGPFDAVAYPSGEALTVVELEPAGPPAEAAALVDDLAGVLAALGAAESIDALLDTVAGWAQAITGFDRVWVYRFEPDDHGVVVAERLAPEVDRDRFLGLHFPARDIPPQARALFLENRVRVIPDVAAEPAPLVPLTNPVTGQWPDLSAGTLRAVSPMHLRYLASLGATASLSIALEVDGRLWGLVSGHHYSGPRVLGQPVRLAAEVLGRLASAQLGAQLTATAAAEQRRRDLARERVLTALAAEPDWAGVLTRAGDALLELADADGVAAVGAHGVEAFGRTPPEATLTALAGLGTGSSRPAAEDPDPFRTDAIAAALAPAFELGSSAGAMVLSLGHAGSAALVFVRDEWRHAVTWGDTGLSPAADRLSPNGSYRTWSESVEGRARPWSELDTEAVGRLGAGIGTVVIDQAERLARSNADLEAFSFIVAHDLREPLRNLLSFLGFFLEDHGDGLDPDGRAQLDTVERLGTRMDGLLESLLEHARAGRLDPVPEPLTLGAAVAAATALLSPEMRRAEVVVAEPETRILADPDAMAHILTNLFTNAVKYARGVPPRIEVSPVPADALARPPRPIRPDERVLAIADHGIGIDDTHAEAIFDLFRRLHPRDAFDGGSGAGLAIARRLAQRGGGELWLDASTPGVGSRFCLIVGGPES